MYGKRNVFGKNKYVIRCICEISGMLSIIFLLLFMIDSVHAEEENAIVYIPIICKSSGGCVIQLNTLNGDQKIEEECISLKNGEKSYFKLSYNASGKYTYIIQQQKGIMENEEENYYQIDVNVIKDSSGCLIAVPTITENGYGEKKAACVFSTYEENIMHCDNVATGDFSKGDRMLGLMIFSVFILLFVAVKRSKHV